MNEQWISSLIGAVREPLAADDDPCADEHQGRRPLTAQEIRSAEDALFEALVERQSRFVWRVAYAMLRNAEDAEDVVQETFMKLYRTGAWRNIRDERGFLARAAWRVALDRLPARNPGKAEEGVNDASRPAASESAAELLDLPSHAATPEQAAVSADWQAAVHRLIDALPEELRQPLALSSVEELNSREIAQLLGISEGTVRTRLMRARSILKQKLAGLMEVRHGR